MLLQISISIPYNPTYPIYLTLFVAMKLSFIRKMRLIIQPGNDLDISG